ncbi:MAG: type II secretion system F family protein, partial [Verrucomicrobiae bacterium]|nr:type II secretion system F family protein [Verrucomicrobiae bacterium]
ATAVSIERGENLASSLAQHKIFPPMLVRMVAAGEQTGKVDVMLEKISDFYDEEIEATLAGLTSLIEPLLIVFLGVVVGSIVVCMFLPIFKLNEIVQF